MTAKWKSALRIFSGRENGNRTTERAINTSSRRLLGFLGQAYTTARISTTDRPTRIDRAWRCGCHASSEASDGVSYWFACPQHEVTYFANGGDRGAELPRGPIVPRRFTPTWQGPVLLLGAAFVAKSVFDTSFLLRRAEEAESASLVDPLTGLYNRRGWNRRILEERKRLKRDSGRVVAVYMLDIDGLKATNDERGHTAGDTLLRQVAKVIQEVTREHDVTARLGGDEFAILTVQSQASEADLIRARLDRGFTAAALSVSVGFAFANSVDTIDEAMERADSAMYEMKKNNAHAVSRR